MVLIYSIPRRFVCTDISDLPRVTVYLIEAQLLSGTSVIVQIIRSAIKILHCRFLLIQILTIKIVYTLSHFYSHVNKFRFTVIISYYHLFF